MTGRTSYWRATWGLPLLLAPFAAVLIVAGVPAVGAAVIVFALFVVLVRTGRKRRRRPQRHPGAK